MQIIITTEEQLKKTISQSLIDFGLRPIPPAIQTYSIRQVAIRLGMAHNTVKKRIAQGKIKTTADNRISEKAIQDYLGNTK